MWRWTERERRVVRVSGCSSTGAVRAKGASTAACDLIAAIEELGKRRVDDVGAHLLINLKIQLGS